MSGGEPTRMQIGEVAARTELSIRTVRHYDELGLVTPSERSEGGFRLYSEGDVQRLLVIRRMKPLGFTLAEMKDLLDSLGTLDDADATDLQRRQAAALITEFQGKTAESISRLRKQLAYAEEFADILSRRGSQGAATG